MREPGRVTEAVGRPASGAGARRSVPEHGLLVLQRAVGNQAVAEMLAGRPGAAPIPHSPGGHWRGVGGPLLPRVQRTAPVQRNWEEYGKRGYSSPRQAEKWTGNSGSKQWYRSRVDSGYEYQYEVTSGSMDTEYEGDWKTRSDWEKLRIDPPPDTAQEAPERYPANRLPQSLGTGWDIPTLFQVLQQHGLEGVCNAMTAAYLTDLIAPSVGGTGVHEANYNRVVLLKNLLDSVVKHYSGVESTEITFAFVCYMKANGLGSAWFEGLKESTIDARFAEFKTYFKEEWKGKKQESAVGEIARPYGQIAVDDLFQMCDDALEPVFDMREGLRGTLDVKAEVKGNHQYEARGHEMAIRYKPGAPVSDSLFEIFDQNGGLARQGVSEQEDLAAIIAEYLHNNYVRNPIQIPNHDVPNQSVPSDFGRFVLRLYP